MPFHLVLEVSAQFSLIDVLLSDLDKTAIAPCASKKDEKKEEEIQDAMPDSTTNSEKSNSNPFHCGDDVLVPNKDGKYYLGRLSLKTTYDLVMVILGQLLVYSYL